MQGVRNLQGRAKAYLLLSDGKVFDGFAMGAAGETVGEVVFNTGMSGYQEVLTDPSYRGQIVTFTHPHIGNYGVNVDDGESGRIHAVGAVVRSLSRRSSNHRAALDFEEWLIKEGIVGICEVDTRALTRHLREQGVTMGMIVHDVDVDKLDSFAQKLAAQPSYESIDYVSLVATSESFSVRCKDGNVWAGELEFEPLSPQDSIDVVVLDYGVKHNILRHLLARGLSVALLPGNVGVDELEALSPRGILFSNGPGDPAKMQGHHKNVRAISRRYPTMGICLGHQLLASAYGGETFKLQYGHRGPNQPVQEVASKKVAITSQNHGFSVHEESMPEELEVTEVNLNDGTVAGFKHRTLPLFAVQYHPEAGPGPADGVQIFDRFVAMLNETPKN